MKILRLFIISILVFLVILSFLFALFPREILVSRVIEIRCEPARAAAVISDLESWKQWNRLIPDSLPAGLEISHPSSGKGAWLKTAQLTVTLEKAGTDSVTTRWTNPRGKEFEGNFAIAGAAPGNTFVQWVFYFHLPWYPWSRLGAMFYEKEIGPRMDSSLYLLKNSLEKQP